eukprot:TRINITY_DN3340_c2_g1_i1.p1 TRINITY_DN3340_c2_g1~~TRINITY_DN3340_c2_g1_i1.p1  ORF type:complete len:457 (+),score=95.51 TRINITY_DN3340_c2_g1_i1:166-1536(+)
MLLLPTVSLFGAAAAAGACSMSIRKGLRVDGNDIKGVNATDVAECCAACDGMPKCGFFVFVSSKELCWLKTSGSGDSRNDSDCTSGEKLIPAGGCYRDEDCNMAGRCVGGVCDCDRGWTGPTCGRIKFGPAYRCGSGGLCMHGEMDNKATWGGEAVQGDDGRWHMYAAMFPNSTLSSWLTDSRVVHAVADNATGPFTAADVALGPRGNGKNTYWDSLTQHNPAAQRAPDGTYLIFYMGNSVSGTADEGNPCSADPSNVPVCTQRVGLATSKSPDGPWTRRDAPIIGPGPAGAWDDQFTTNPTPHVRETGYTLLVYKARSVENFNVMTTGVAYANHWSGPYNRTGIKLDVPGNCEDAGIYYSQKMQVYRLIFHCGCAYRYAWSKDGMEWTTAPDTVPWCDIQFSDGTNGTVSRRERPKWVVNKDGDLTHLYTAVQPTKPTDPVHGTNTFTLATEILP